jgi:hypothetical protein
MFPLSAGNVVVWPTEEEKQGKHADEVTDEVIDADRAFRCGF